MSFKESGSSSCKASDECSSNGDCSGSYVCCDCVCKSSCGTAEVSLMGLGLAFNAQGSKYTSDILGPVLPGTYTMEVTQAGREWEEPPTIVSIRLLLRQCHPP